MSQQTHTLSLTEEQYLILEVSLRLVLQQLVNKDEQMRNDFSAVLHNKKNGGLEGNIQTLLEKEIVRIKKYHPEATSEE